MIDRNLRSSRVGMAALLAFGLVGLFTEQNQAFGADEPRKILWLDDLAQAQAQARTSDRLLWIQFTGPWCINCRRMDRSTFVHPSVVNESRERFVPVKLRSDEYEALAQSLNLTMLPSTVIVRPNGEVVEKFEGYGDPETFEGFLHTVLRQEGRTAEQVAAREKARKDEAIGLAGYCPVTLLQQSKLVPGKPNLTLEHEGRVYHFTSEASLAAFRQKPAVFAPANNGHCPVSQVDRGDLHTGDPRWGVVYTGHLFLFKDGAERDRFVKDPERYARVDAAGHLNCPSCWTRSRLARQSPTRFSSSYPYRNLPTSAPSRIEALLNAGNTIRR